MELIITSWKSGLKTISLIKLLRARGDLGLKEAKDLVEPFMAGQEISISGLDEEDAKTLRGELEELGAICRE